MPRISERGTVSGGSSFASWNINKFSDMFWGFFNVAYFFFVSLFDPLMNAGKNATSGSRSSNSRGPPRPPGSRNFRTFAEAFGSSDNVPPPPPGG